MTSWVIVNKSTQSVVCEIFNKKHMEAINTEKYEVIPIKEYLYSLNKPTIGR